MHLLLVALFAAVAQAATPLCSAVHRRCNSPEKLASATTYCASYLGIPTVTTTVTISTTTAPSCMSVSSPPPPASQSASAPPRLKARTTDKEPLCLKRHAPMSSACACLSLSSTMTTTQTATATATGPFYIVGEPGTAPTSFASVNLGNPYVGFGDYSADSWVIAPNGSIYDVSQDSYLAYEQQTPYQQGEVPVFLSSQSAAASNNFQPLNCTIDTTNNCALDCTVNGNINNFLCYGVQEWYLSMNAISSDQCSQFQPYARV